jgi:hypothetical protein
MNKLNAKVGDLFFLPLYNDKKKELEELMKKDISKNPNNFSKRSWDLVFQTLEFVFNSTPIYIYNNKSKVKKERK